MSVWVTRSAPDNLSTARGLKALGRRPLLVPVLTTRGLRHGEPDAMPDALLFSSVHAVRHHRLGERFQKLPVFAASGAVAAAASAAGYLTVTSTCGSDRALRGLLRHVLPPGARVTMFCAERTSDALETELQNSGVRLERRVVYEPIGLDDRDMKAALERLERIRAVTIHSRTAAERLLPLFSRTGWRGSVWCISRAAALPFADAPGLSLAVSDRPSEDMFLSMVSRLGPQAAGPERTPPPPPFRPLPFHAGRGGRETADNDNTPPPGRPA